MKLHECTRAIALGIENLLLHKLRSILTMIGVVFGVGSVVAMLSVGEGASKEALEQIQRLGSNNIIVSSVKSMAEESPTAHRIRMSVYGLTYHDFERLGTTFAAVSRAAPAKIVRKDARLHDKTMEVRVVGTTSAWFELLPRNVICGRTLTAYEDEHRNPVAVVTETVARRLLAGRSALGESIRVGGGVFTVIGVVQNGGGASGAIQSPDQPIDIYVPINVAKDYFGDINRRMISGTFEIENVELHQLVLQTASMADVESVAAGIEEMLRRSHKNKDYAISVPLALLKQAQATKRTFNIVLGSIACISLLVGGIGIMNIMLAAVTERTREIGIRRAIGAKRKHIIVQFLIETVVLSTTGGLLGLGIGMIVPWAITYFSGMATVLTYWGVLLPLSISVAIGIIFGLYPAFHAANVDPIVALRHE